jgi:serine/threonine protein kinase
MDSLRYLAPEVLRRIKNDVEQAVPREYKSVDVFSFGAILHEVLVGGVPFKNVSDIDALLSLLEEGKRPKMTNSEEAYEFLRILLKECWETEETKRPSMSKVYHRLKDNIIVKIQPE